MLETLSTAVSVAAVGLFRNVAGWLENAVEDGSISPYEWGSLGATLLRHLVLGLGLYWGLDLSGLEAAAGALLGDLVLERLRKY